MNIKKQCIAFTGGGTGGHIQPIVSLLEYGYEQGFNLFCDFFWFGEKKSQESKIAKNIEYVFFIPIFSGKMRRYWTLYSIVQNIRDFLKVIRGFFQSLYLLKKYHINILFCKGGYVALPVSCAAKVLGINILIHESDMYAGLVNRFVVKFANIIFTGFTGIFSQEIVIGQILSGKLGQWKNAGIKEEANIDKKKTNILIMGGSQGSAKIFDILLQLLNMKNFENIHFLVLLGTQNQIYKKFFRKYKNVQSFEFLKQEDVAYLYANSDIAITRGSATSLAEQQLFGIKKIIIPLPFTGGNHQFYNALEYCKLYKDFIIEQNKYMKINILMFLEKLGGYKKKRKGIDMKKIDESKRIIWNQLKRL